MYRASDRVTNEEWLSTLDEAAAALELSEDARTTARDLFLAAVPDSDRSKAPAVAASLYAGALVAGDQRPQGAVADAVGVSRVAVQQRWKRHLRAAGLDPPGW